MFDNDVTFSGQMHFYFLLVVSYPRLLHTCVSLILENLNVKCDIFLCGNWRVCFLIFHELRNHFTSYVRIPVYNNN